MIAHALETATVNRNLGRRGNINEDLPQFLNEKGDSRRRTNDPHVFWALGRRTGVANSVVWELCFFFLLGTRAVM